MFYTGPTTINAGNLDIAGFLHPDSVVTVKNGGTLEGDGVAGPVIVESGGTIKPCCLITTGDLTIQPGGIFDTFTDAFNADMILSNGSVNVTGGVLTIDMTSAAGATLGDSVTILEKTTPGPIVGTFANLPEGAVITDGTTTARISYVGGDGNDVTLTFTTATVPAAPVIGTATPGNASANVAFTTPANGGGTIVSYTIVPSPAAPR
jgi:hypothetical protein